MNAMIPQWPQQWKKADQHLLQQIQKHSVYKEIPVNTQILREGQYVSHVPLVLSGLIKVFSGFDERELLLYYIREGESCVMSYSAAINNETSRIFANTEADTSLLLMPVERMFDWSLQFPDFNRFFFKQYFFRYSDLLETIGQVLFSKMDERLYAYLKQKVVLTHKNPIKLSHKHIANEMGTAREVVSRVLKKLESEQMLKQTDEGIEILKL